MTHRITCKNGPEHTHETVEESRLCWQGKLYKNGQWSSDPLNPTGATRPVDGTAGSGVTGYTPEPPAPVVAPVAFAAQPRTIVPLPMLVETPDGYFAVRLDDNDPYRFLRIKRPMPRKGVRTKHLGCIKVQSQHSDDLKPVMIYRPLDALETQPQELLWISNPALEKHLILVLVDPMGAGLAYGRELGQCCICGRTLTDERSRHYAIGPECEKGYPDRIEYVDGLEAEANEL